MLTFKEYQDQSRKTAVYPERGHNVVYPALGLAGEAGEVAEKVKKMIRDEGGRLGDSRRQELARELGDVLWYVSQLAAEIGITLEEIAQTNLKKLASRKDRGKLSGDGDNR